MVCGCVCVVIFDGVQNGDNGGKEEFYKSVDVELNQVKLFQIKYFLKISNYLIMSFIKGQND